MEITERHWETWWALALFFSVVPPPPPLSEKQMPAPFTYLKERNLGQEEQTRQKKQKCENLLQGN